MARPRRPSEDLIQLCHPDPTKKAVSASWYAMAIKLDMDARGELKRVNRRPPQRIVRA